MKKHFVFMLAVVAMVAIFGTVQAETPPKAPPMMSHNVYFSLKDNSPQAKQKLIAACKKYLSGHPDTVWFAVGSIAEEMKRDVNDRDFDVSLHLVFKNKAAYEPYAKATRHMKFIEENKDNWTKVRVFDSYLEE
jgi:hypothetical protein